MRPRAEAPCELLPWDSQLFGIRIARIVSPSVDDATLTEALSWCREQHVACVYLLVPGDHEPSIRAAEHARFELVDIRVTLATAIEPHPSAPVTGVRQAQPKDRDALAALARISHRNTRFYFDRRFDTARCDDLYATWILKSVEGELADVVLVSHDGDAVDGYVSARVAAEGAGNIGLIAVAPHAQGKGRGRALIASAFDWFRSRGVTHVTVATQGRSARALRFYEQCGFCTASVQLWYHLWLDAQ
jgi:dTDP-4-amino-4,6-dideoxy-D-galactose acyltransferase